jgi:hypothetical protein
LEDKRQIALKGAVGSKGKYQNAPKGSLWLKNQNAKIREEAGG